MMFSVVIFMMSCVMMLGFRNSKCLIDNNCDHHGRKCPLESTKEVDHSVASETWPVLVSPDLIPRIQRSVSNVYSRYSNNKENIHMMTDIQVKISHYSVASTNELLLKYK